MHSGKRYNIDFRKNKKVLIITIILIIIGLSYGIIMTVSKYVFYNQSIKMANASEFYFSSDLLSEDNVQNNLDNWNGESEYNFEFKISNYEDSLRISPSATQYQIRAEVLEPEELKDKINIKYYIDQTETNIGNLSGDTKQDNNIKININPNGNKITDKLVLKVYATSISPYEKTLMATYNIAINPDVTAYKESLKSAGDYEKLLIETYTFSGKMTITYDTSKLDLYRSTKLIENSTKTEGTAIVELEQNSNYQIEFIKKSKDENIVLGKDILVK